MLPEFLRGAAVQTRMRPDLVVVTAPLFEDNARFDAVSDAAADELGTVV